MDHLGPFLLGLLYLFGLVVAICWIVLPFALIGTKPVLRSLLHEQQRTNALLEKLLRPPAA